MPRRFITVYGFDYDGCGDALSPEYQALIKKYLKKADREAFFANVAKLHAFLQEHQSAITEAYSVSLRVDHAVDQMNLEQGANGSSFATLEKLCHDKGWRFRRWLLTDDFHRLQSGVAMSKRPDLTFDPSIMAEETGPQIKARILRGQLKNIARHHSAPDEIVNYYFIDDDTENVIFDELAQHVDALRQKYPHIALHFVKFSRYPNNIPPTIVRAWPALILEQEAKAAAEAAAVALPQPQPATAHAPRVVVSTAAKVKAALAPAPHASHVQPPSAAGKSHVKATKTLKHGTHAHSKAPLTHARVKPQHIDDGRARPTRQSTDHAASTERVTVTAALPKQRTTPHPTRTATLPKHHTPPSSAPKEQPPLAPPPPLQPQPAAHYRTLAVGTAPLPKQQRLTDRDTVPLLAATKAPAARKEIAPTEPPPATATGSRRCCGLW